MYLGLNLATFALYVRIDLRSKLEFAARAKPIVSNHKHVNMLENYQRFTQRNYTFFLLLTIRERYVLFYSCQFNWNRNYLVSPNYELRNQLYYSASTPKNKVELKCILVPITYFNGSAKKMYNLFDISPYHVCASGYFL